MSEAKEPDENELVRCPNDCMLSSGLGYSPVVSRVFDWVEEAGPDIGVRNYCTRCGAELVPATIEEVEA